MGSFLLAIDGGDVVTLAHLNQSRQSHFGAVGEGAEHGLTKNGFADAHEIKPGYQLIIQPCFHTVCVACLMQSLVCRHHAWHDPGTVLSFSWTLRTRFDHLVE